MTSFSDTNLTLGFLPNLSIWEILLILVFALLLFGRRLPEVGKSLGKGIVEFKKGLREVEETVERETSKPPNPPAYRPPLGTEPARPASAEVVDPAPTGTEAKPQ
jgi:sec-independent protein translocase protein TatA